MSDNMQHECVPYLYVLTARKRPSFITGAGLLGMRMKYVSVPSAVASLPEREKLAALGAAIRAHYAVSDRECPLFGAITGYAYRAPGCTTLFEVTGEVREACVDDAQEDGWAEVRRGRHPVVLL